MTQIEGEKKEILATWNGLSHHLNRGREEEDGGSRLCGLNMVSLKFEH